MFKKKKGLWAGILLLAAAVCMLFAACGGSGKVKLSFDTGDGPKVESVEVKKGEEYTLPVPEWEGYSFEGWYENSDLTGTPVTEVTAEKKTTFYAKWEQMYAITLQLGGGTLAGGKTVLYAKAGTNIKTFMQDYVPTYAEHQFGEWLVGTAPLSADATLTTAGVTLTAHYQVAYTAELHLQKLGEDGYDVETYHGFGYAGEQPVPDKKGFEVAEHEGATQKALSDTPSQNNDFVLYMNRKQVTVYLMANHETLTGSDQTTISEPYGTQMELPVPFSFDGDCLVGWSTEPRGEVKYRSSYMGSILYNGTLGSDPFTFEETTNLYAVWAKGYLDLFGGDDLVFHLSDDAKEIYLLRGGVLFEGEYMQSTGTFLFMKPGADLVMLQGKLNTDGTFCISDQDRVNLTCTYFKNGVGADEKYRILLDKDNGITYVDSTLPVTEQESKGSYTIDENGYYHVTYTEGHLAGEEFLYVIDTESARFMVRDEEEFGWGAIPRAVVNGRTIVSDDSISITLNGFGVALFQTGSSSTNYYYRRDENNDKKIILLSALQTTVGEVYLTEVNGKIAFLLYSSSYDHTYTAEEGEMGTLTLDGMSKASYTDGEGTAIEGLYRPFTSELGTLVLFIPASSDNDPKIFLTYTKTETIPAEGEEQPTQKTNYLFREVQITYQEIQYFRDGYIYYAPLLVLDEKTAGEASVYGYVSATRTYVKVLTGTYTHDETTGLYTFTTTQVLPTEETLSSPVDILALKSFTFSIGMVADSDGIATNVMYWHSMTLKGEEEGSDDTTTYGKKYTGENGATLTITQGFGVYQNGTETVSGVIATDESGITSLYDAENDEEYYFRLDETEGTFTLLDGLIGTLYVWANGTSSANERLTFDGSPTKATYTVVTAGADGESTTATYEGTYAQTNETTPSGTPIFEFTADGMTFKYILVAISSTSMRFAKYDETLSGVYTCGSASLELDGFCANATYMDDAGVEHMGSYTVSENVVRLTAAQEGRYYYFDLKDGKTFTVRDEAYGGYVYMNNQNIVGLGFQFDGYRHLTVIDLTISGDQDNVICEDGTYEKQENGSYVVKYKVGAEEFTLTGWLGTVTVGSTPYNAFELEYKEVIMSFVNEDDWSVLVLDGHGNAKKYDKKGYTEEGQYLLITDNMLYYANTDGTAAEDSEASIYIYDKEKGTATPVNNVQRAYFSENFDALLFTKYGFMVMNGETRYYYNVGADNRVVLYRRAQEGETQNVNKYGFVEDNFFGTFGETYTAENGTVYYRSESFTLRFTREDSDKTKYPVTMIEQGQEEKKYPLERLQFSPTGSAEFTDSSARVTINDHEYSCTVRRVKEDDDQYHMYILIPTAGIGNFVFEIDLSYKGENTPNSYTIKSMRTETELDDMVYITYLLNYMMQGYIIENSFGTITLTTKFDEAGVAGEPTASGWFGDTLKAVGMTNTNGEVVSFTDVAYEVNSGVYSVTFDGGDDYTYSLHFGLDSSYYNYFGIIGYGIYAFTRNETLETTDGYTVTLERVLFTENGNITIGGYWDLNLSKDETALECDASYLLNGQIYYFVRTTEEETNKITASTLYLIELKQENSDTVDEEADPLAPYKSVTVTQKSMTVAYDANGTDYVEFDSEHSLAFMRRGRTLYIFVGENCKYDDTTSTFTFTLTTDTTRTTFTVKITTENDTTTATITENVEEIEPPAQEGAPSEDVGEEAA